MKGLVFVSKKFSTRYSPPPQVPFVFTEASMTSQDDLRSSDINNILKRYDEDGVLISPGQKVLQNMEFGDTTLYPDYETAMSLIQSVEDDFYNLPAEDRMKFGNDPRVFIRAVGSNPEIVKQLGIFDNTIVPHDKELVDKVLNGNPQGKDNNDGSPQDPTKKEENSAK